MAASNLDLKKIRENFRYLTDEQENINNAHTTVVARQNRIHNRYTDILPYDDTRVTLQERDDRNQEQYINASLIRGLNNDRVEYIASQGPKDKAGAAIFWQMVWEYDVRLIVMLTKCEENKKNKCYEYWPKDIQKEQTPGNLWRPYGNTLVKSDEIVTRDGYVKTKFTLRKVSQQQDKIVTHLHYVDWPDHGAPVGQRFAPFFSEARTEMQRVGYEKPILVHCSAGVGRTGSFITLDLLMRSQRQINNQEIYQTVRDIIIKLRHCRMTLVQTVEQLIFIHQFYDYLRSLK